MIIRFKKLEQVMHFERQCDFCQQLITAIDDICINCFRDLCQTCVHWEGKPEVVSTASNYHYCPDCWNQGVEFRQQINRLELKINIQRQRWGRRCPSVTSPLGGLPGSADSCCAVEQSARSVSSVHPESIASDPEAPDFDHWWTQIAEHDPLGDKKSLAYRAWCAGAATGTVTPKLDSLEMLYRIARKEGWCAEAPASGLPVQSESIGSDHEAPVSKTTNAESDASQSWYATGGTRRFNEWWDKFQQKPSLNSSLAREIAWHAWSAAHKKLGASMAGDDLSLNPAWLCQCGTAYEGARPKARMDLAPDRLADEGGICVWACKCGIVYEGEKPPVCDPARTRFEVYSRGLDT